MTYFTAEELCMIEMLTYFNEAKNEIYGAISLLAADYNTFSEDTKDQTIGEILSAFDEERIALLKSNDNIIDTTYYISGKEWGEIIEYITHSPTLSSLRYTDCLEKGDKKLALCFTDGKDNDEAIVAFLGTANNEEWLDNVRAATMEDSLCQEEAYKYINGLSYDDITVIGHSKGGNKAMYAAIRSDKVTRCVSFDGQGFSREFMAKYSGRISERAGIIKNYSLSTDFVHILLNQIPGSDQYYCKGYGITSPGSDLDDMLSVIGQNHSPNSFFKTDNSGIVTDIDFDGNDIPVFEIIDESSAMILLKNYASYIFDVSDKSASKALMGYIENVMSAVLYEDDVSNAIFNDTDQLGTLLGYTFNYIYSNSLDEYDVKNLLSALGLYQFTVVQVITKFLFNTTVGKIATDVAGAAAKCILYQFMDGKDDYLLKSIIWDCGKKYISKELDMMEFYHLWDKIEEKFEDARNGIKSYYDENSGIANDVLNFMATDTFKELVKNDDFDVNVIDEIVKNLKNGLLEDKEMDSAYILLSLKMFFTQCLKENDYTLKFGDDNDDYLIGPNENCLSFLGKGENIFFGGNGKDIIIGGTGKDSIAGGQGNDTLSFMPESNHHPRLTGSASIMGALSITSKISL